MIITKATNNFPELDFNTGQVLLFDKPKGWSSFKVVHILRKLTGAAKVGHAGTLDPMATGLLILCTGKKTKTITEYQDLRKTYEGSITLGKRSPSMDLESEITEILIPESINENEILKVRDSFLGEIEQIPPMYSAVKFKGKSLYKLARKGKDVEREPRKIQIFEFDIIKLELPEIYFRIVCSKGTYIRVIADELGKKLGTGALLSSLRRTHIGQYSVEEALKIENLEEIYANC